VGSGTALPAADFRSISGCGFVGVYSARIERARNSSFIGGYLARPARPEGALGATALHWRYVAGEAAVGAAAGWI